MKNLILKGIPTFFLFFEKILQFLIFSVFIIVRDERSIPHHIIRAVGQSIIQFYRGVKNIVSPQSSFGSTSYSSSSFFYLSPFPKKGPKNFSMIITLFFFLFFFFKKNINSPSSSRHEPDNNNFWARFFAKP